MKQIKSALILILILLNYLSILADNFPNVEVIEIKRWSEFFDKASLDGTFILHKLDSDTLLVYNKERAFNEYPPASTFKILNSLISLECKAVNDENEIIKWDGKIRSYDKWNQDQNMLTAIKYSCVWFYQELARRVGEKKMKKFLKLSNYGNAKIGSDIDKFWLEGDLRISAYEQIKFLDKFLRKELPFSKRNLESVKNAILVDSSEFYFLYAKTGWTARIDQQVGWYVGFLETNEETWIFAMNIDIKIKEDAEYREIITYNILKREGLIKR